MHTPIHWWLRKRVPHECALISIAVNNGNVISLLQNSHSCLNWYHYLRKWVCFVIWDTLLRSSMHWVSILMSVCDVIAVVIDLAAIVVNGSEFVLLLEPGSFLIKICISFLPSFCLCRSLNKQALTQPFYMILPFLNYQTSCTLVSRD